MNTTTATTTGAPAGANAAADRLLAGRAKAQRHAGAAAQQVLRRPGRRRRSTRPGSADRRRAQGGAIVDVAEHHVRRAPRPTGGGIGDVSADDACRLARPRIRPMAMTPDPAASCRARTRAARRAPRRDLCRVCVRKSALARPPCRRRRRPHRRPRADRRRRPPIASDVEVSKSSPIQIAQPVDTNADKRRRAGATTAVGHPQEHCCPW